MKVPHNSISVWMFLLGMAALIIMGIPASATSSDDLDIGAPAQAGSTSLHDGVYTISGGGADIGGKADHFHFNRGTLTGSGTVTAYILRIGGSSPLAKGGVMLRNSAAADSVFAAVLVTPTSGLSFQSRAVLGGQCATQTLKSIHAPVWVRVKRTGSFVGGFYSADGLHWTRIGPARVLPLSKTVLAGAAVTAHRAAALSPADFTDVAVTPDVDERFLHVVANGVCDRSGHLVTLRGTNIGGWLVTERWMCGQSDAPGSSKSSPYASTDPNNSGRFALEQMEARFGPARANTLINVWRDHWFTDRDLDNLHSYGFNLIRVPFDWRNLQDANGHWYRDAHGSIDFSRFDWVVQEAAKRGMYVIFVFHVWPGQQQNYGAICQAGEPGAAERVHAAALWSALAQHFKGSGTIAAFDLINEPTGSNDFYNAHRAFYAAIRAQDPERMLVAEWVNTADFPKLGWTNTLCSGHYPAGSAADFAKFLAQISTHNEYSTGLPCFVGECKSDDSVNAMQNAADMTQEFDRLGWAWATWTYKTVNQGGWGLFNYNGSVSYNLTSDSYDTILKMWTTALTQWENPAAPVNSDLKTDLISGFQHGAAYVRPALLSGRHYEIVNVNSGRTLDTWGGGAGTQVMQYQSTLASFTNKNDSWLATRRDDGNWTFASTDGLLLADSGSGKANGAMVIQAASTGERSQEWQVILLPDGTCRVVNAFSGLDMEVTGASSDQGGPIDQGMSIPGAASQHWTFAPLD